MAKLKEKKFVTMEIQIKYDVQLIACLQLTDGNAGEETLPIPVSAHDPVLRFTKTYQVTLLVNFVTMEISSRETDAITDAR